MIDSTLRPTGYTAERGDACNALGLLDLGNLQFLSSLFMNRLSRVTNPSGCLRKISA